jgi:hypothetical protein
MPKKSARLPTWTQLLVTRSELARRLGRSRSHMTALAAGRLRDACIGVRMDAGHPSVLAYAAELGIALPALLDGLGVASRPTLMITETAIDAAELARLAGVSLEEAVAAIEGPLAAAVIPAAHVSLARFAALAGTSTTEVIAATRDELKDALVPSGRLDVSAVPALEWLAARPIQGDEAPDISDARRPDGTFDPAHPLTRAFFTRAWGHVPTDAEIESIGGAA